MKKLIVIVLTFMYITTFGQEVLFEELNTCYKEKNLIKYQSLFSDNNYNITGFGMEPSRIPENCKINLIKIAAIKIEDIIILNLQNVIINKVEIQ